jgi:hypothetical protein
MPTTACTDNYYSPTIPLSSTGGTATVTPAKPEWTDGDKQRTIQCNAVTIGGSGLNN